MCPPKTRTPPPPAAPPAAPPPPAATAVGFASPNGGANDSGITARRRGIESLRVGLNVPGPAGGKGAQVP